MENILCLKLRPHVNEAEHDRNFFLKKIENVFKIIF